MKKLLVIGLFLIAILGCNKRTDTAEDIFVAKVVGFDLNCSTCILSFPFDSVAVKNLLGESEHYYYQTVNLAKNDFKIGQMLTVKVRKALDTELKACITLYPSYNYKNIYVSGFSSYNGFKYNDTIDLAYGNCLNDFTGNSTICFDSVITDSRCPIGVFCIWGGEAIARFKFTSGNNKPTYIDLRLQTIDTVVYGYKFSFLELLPYPRFGTERKPEDYKARIVIKRN